MKKKSRKLVIAFAVILMLVNVFSLTGCGSMENTSAQEEMEVQSGISETGQDVTAAITGAEVSCDEDSVQTSNDKQGAETGGMIRAYSDTEKERMAKLKESYQNETAKPEKMIQEVDSAEGVTEGTLCYIISTGEYYLPGRELTDEELLEIIDCNFRITLNTNRKTEAEWEAEDRAKRAELEANVKAADGISEEEAIEIAQKAMEDDIGEKAKGMQLRPWEERYGWKTDLCIADWSEIKEEDRGAIGYYMQFDFGDDSDDTTSYHCTVNAVDGSILEAYRMEYKYEGDSISWDTVYYEH